MATVTSVLDSVQEDLKPFTDPGTTLTWAGDQRSATAEWESRAQRLSASFRVTAQGDIQVSFEGCVLSYKQFLAHTSVADLLGLAAMIDQAFKPGLYVSTKAVADPPQPAQATIRTLLDEASANPTTSVVFITGDAGAGKTSVLRELVRTQAQRYRRGESVVLYLYVNAQGRALARFDEALAIALQDLRARLTYSALPALVRNGILVPVVDGFDELLGTTGYDDAFASLRRFIDELSGTGQIVASARSTYYEQEFVSRASAVPQNWSLIPVSVLEWGEEEFGEYLASRFALEPSPEVDQLEFSRLMRSCFSLPSDRDLRGKPFFVATAADLILGGRTVVQGQSLIEQFVDAYIERDRTEKLVDPGGAPFLTRAQIEGLFVLIAEEMWLQETRELDLGSVKEVAEVFLSAESGPLASRERVIQRMSKSAFLMRGGTESRVAFEHEIFLAWFLARSVSPALLRGPESTRSFLLRGTLPARCAGFSVGLLGSQVATASLLRTLSKASATSLMRGQRVKENAGALAVAALRVAHGSDTRGEDLELCDLVFAGESLAGLHLARLRLLRSEFKRVDLTDLRIESSSAEESWFSDVTVDPATTWLEIVGLTVRGSFSGLRVRSNGGTRQVYDHREMAAVLRGIGVPLSATEATTTRSVARRAVEVVEESMRALERTSVMWPGDDRHRSLREKAEWEGVKRLMVQYQILAREVRGHRGVPRESLRRNFPPNLVLAGIDAAAEVPDGVRAFWVALESTFPAAGTLES